VTAGSRSRSKPIRIVLLWQAATTAVVALTAGLWVGLHGAGSALLGGAVSLIAGAVSGWVAARGRPASAGAALVGALVAEGIKIVLAAVLLWAVLTAYSDVVVAVFVGAFLLTMLIFSMAFFVRDDE